LIPSLSDVNVHGLFPLFVISLEDIGLRTADETRRRWPLVVLCGDGDGDGDGGSGIARTSKQSATLKPSRKWVFCNALGCDALLLVIGTDDNDRRSAG